MLINWNGYRREQQRSYSDRLKALHLPTLKYRRFRDDMIEVLKIIKGMYDPACAPQFEFINLGNDTVRTRGN